MDAAEMLSNERLADPADIASHQEQLALQSALSIAASKRGPKATGRCLYCGEELVPHDVLESIAATGVAPEGTKRFCDAECREGYDYEQNIRSKQRA